MAPDVWGRRVAGGGAAAIVEEAGRHAGRLPGGAPGRVPAGDGDAVAVEDERARRVATPGDAAMIPKIPADRTSGGPQRVQHLDGRAPSSAWRAAALLHEYPVGVGSRVVGRLWP